MCVFFIFSEGSAVREPVFLRDMSGDPALLSGLRAVRALSADSGFDVVLTMPDGSMHHPSGPGPEGDARGQIIASSGSSSFFLRADVFHCPPAGGQSGADATDDLVLLGRAIDFLAELERLSAAFFSGSSFYNSTGAVALSNAV